jgi:hypothetical protein
MHRHEISFSVFEASVFYQWQAHCMPRDGMRKENLRCGTSGNCTPIPSNWIARCTIAWWRERDSSAAVSAAIGRSHDHSGEGETPSRRPARCRHYIRDVDSTLAGALARLWEGCSSHRPRSSKRVVHDVKVANRGQNKCVMQADVVCQKTHAQRNDRSSDNRHDQQSRPVSRERP